MALVLAAGCAGSGADEDLASEEECLLGGPPQPPPAERQAFPLDDDHLDHHPILGDVFSSPGYTVPVMCDEGAAVFEFLSSEGADVNFRPSGYGHDVYLTHEETTLFVALRLQA